MAKDYNEVTSQVAVLKNSKVTTAFYINVKPTPKDRFMELIEGKVKISINDFSSGRGDNATRVYYNLDLADVKYLYEMAKTFRLPEPVMGSKIIGMAPQKAGPYKGLCFSSKLQIRRQATTSSGEKMRSPWSIQISNGYAQAAPGKVRGTYYEASGTFKEVGKARVMLTDKDMLDVMDKIISYLNVYKQLVGNDLVPGYLAELESKYEQGYSNNLSYSKPVPAQEVTQEAVEDDIDNEIPFAVDIPKPEPKPKTTKSVDKHEVTMLINSDAVLDNGIYTAQAVIKGREYNVKFKTLPKEIEEASANSVPIKCYLGVHNQEFWFMGLVV